MRITTDDDLKKLLWTCADKGDYPNISWAASSVWSGARFSNRVFFFKSRTDVKIEKELADTERRMIGEMPLVGSWFFVIFYEGRSPLFIDAKTAEKNEVERRSWERQGSEAAARH